MFSLTQKIDMDDLIKLLSKIKITESGKQRRTDNELFLSLMSTPILQKTFLSTLAVVSLLSRGSVQMDGDVVVLALVIGSRMLYLNIIPVRGFSKN